MTSAELKKKLRRSDHQRDRDALMALAEVKSETIAIAWHLWERNAPSDVQGMLTGEGWRWDEKIQGYRGQDGQVVSGKRLKLLAMQISDSIRRDMQNRALLLPIGFPPLIWRHDMGLLVAGSFLLMGALAAGGFQRLTPRMKNELVGKVRDPGGLAFSLDHLATWGRKLDDDREGKGAWDHIEPEGMKPGDRADLYGAASNTAFERISRISHEDAVDEKGKRLFMFERNILGKNENHCKPTEWTDGCKELTDAGWLPIGTMSEPGTRTCGPRCKCHMVYSESRDTFTNN